MEMKAVKEQRTLRKQPTRDVCFHGSNKYTNGIMENVLFVYFVFYLLLKCDRIEETLVAHSKCVE